MAKFYDSFGDVYAVEENGDVWHVDGTVIFEPTLMIDGLPEGAELIEDSTGMEFYLEQIDAVRRFN